MALKEELERSGNWLFRWRGVLPVILIVFFAMALSEYHYINKSESLEVYWRIFSLLVGFTGIIVRGFTIGHTPKRTSGRNRKKQVAESLNTTGIYSVVRNPLYLGNYLMILGPVLFVHNWWLIFVFTLSFWLYYERIVFAEEAFLRNKFGEEYLKWAEKTPIFIPSFRNYKSSGLPFSFKNVLKREYNGLFAMMATFAFLDIASHYMVISRFKMDFSCQILFVSSFFIWIILHILRKATKLLDVQGR